MIDSALISFDRNVKAFYFACCPTVRVGYLDVPPDSSEELFALKIREDSKIFIRYRDLRAVGVSIKILQKTSFADWWKVFQNVAMISHLMKQAIALLVSSEEEPFFKKENIPFASRIILDSIHRGIQHRRHYSTIPGMYFDYSSSITKIFINVKGTYLKIGGYTQVKQALWLNHPDGPQLVAKKGLRKGVYEEVRKKEGAQNFITGIHVLQEEAEYLKRFAGKRGITPLLADLCSGNGKWAIFLPLYECNFFDYLNDPFFAMTLEEKLEAISQWLEGLATLAEPLIGFENLLLRRGKRGVEAVIADWSDICEDEWPPMFFPPEYHVKIEAPFKQGVWAMGLALHQLFAEGKPAFWMYGAKAMQQWSSTAISKEALEYSMRKETPKFVEDLINRMLSPNSALRPTAAEASRSFEIEYAVYRGE